MNNKKIPIIIASITIPAALIGTLILTYPDQTNLITNEGPVYEIWSFEYDGTVESFPTESLGQKICDVCETPIPISIGFLKDAQGPSSKSTLERNYDREITNDTISMRIDGSWIEQDRQIIKQFVEEIPGVSDVQFEWVIMP